MEERYSLITPEAFANPYPIYARMRAEVPVYWVEVFNSWFLTRYDHLKPLYNDPRVITSNPINKIPSLLSQDERQKIKTIDDFLALWVVFMDPPEHTHLRQLLNKGFKPSIIKDMHSRIQTIVDDLLNDMSEMSQIDFITQFAYPLPSLIISEILGFPKEGQALLKAWSQKIAVFFIDQTLKYTPQSEAMYGTVNEIREYIGSLLDERRRHPQDDMFTSFLDTEVDGSKLTDDEIISSSILLLFAGHETTQNLLGNGLFALFNHPDQLDLLKSNPAYIETAIEEFLRYDGPNQFSIRELNAEVEFAGKTIRPGEKIFLGLGAANHDPQQFENPETLDITRDPNPHLMFGHGIHFCLGAPLARLEGKIAFNTILRRLVGLRLTDIAPVWRPSFTLRGLSTFPIIFDEILPA